MMEPECMNASGLYLGVAQRLAMDHSGSQEGHACDTEVLEGIIHMATILPWSCRARATVRLYVREGEKKSESGFGAQKRYMRRGSNCSSLMFAGRDVICVALDRSSLVLTHDRYLSSSKQRSWLGADRRPGCSKMAEC